MLAMFAPSMAAVSCGAATARRPRESLRGAPDATHIAFGIDPRYGAAVTSAPPARRASALERYAPAVLVVLCAALYLPPAVATPFFTKGEPREGLVVRRMVEHGEWMLPRRPSGEGLAIASKPPLFHWLGAL